jgi:hypothetical protein
MMGWYSLFGGKTAMFYWADGAERADRQKAKNLLFSCVSELMRTEINDLQNLG